jgi:hypothetical protein
MKKIIATLLLIFASVFLQAEITQINIPSKYNGTYKELLFSIDQGTTAIKPKTELIIKIEDDLVINPGGFIWTIDKILYDDTTNTTFFTFKDKDIAWILIERDNFLLIIFVQPSTKQEIFRAITININLLEDNFIEKDLQNI